MNILHQNNEIQDGCNCRNKKYSPLGRRSLSPYTNYVETISPCQPNFTGKVYFVVADKTFKDTPNPLFTKIIQKTQNSRNNFGKLKREISFQKRLGASLRKCPPYSV